VKYEMKEGKPVGFCEKNPGVHASAFLPKDQLQKLEKGPIFFSYDVEFYVLFI